MVIKITAFEFLEKLNKYTKLFSFLYRARK